MTGPSRSSLTRCFLSRNALSASDLEIPLPPGDLRDWVRRAVEEDLGTGDRSSELTVAAAARARGKLIAKQELVVAGLPVAELVGKFLDPKVDWENRTREGELIAAGTILAEVEGPARILLAAERVSLNFLQHLSGIATLTRKFTRLLEGTRSQLRDTRKTLPGLRALEKYAVRVGGGRNHRMRLDDGVLIKANHLRLAGGLRTALEGVQKGLHESLPVEVEVVTLAELREAVEAGADRVLLDNMTPQQVRECVGWTKGLPDRSRRVELEVSGGITLQNVRRYAQTGVDYIAVGALTHSAPAADIHFWCEPA